MTSLQPTQAQCLGCIRKGATVTTSGMWAVKLLGSYLIATYEANIPIQTQMLDHTPRSQAMWEELGSGLRTRLQQ